MEGSRDPTVQRQRDRWVVRVDGFDTENGKRRPRQIGSYPSERKAVAAARAALVEEPIMERGTVGWLVNRYVESRADVSTGTRQQYVWASTHITSGLGAIRLDRLDRDDIRQWLGTMAASGQLSKRSISICRFVLRAALADAVDEGARRTPASSIESPSWEFGAPSSGSFRFSRACRLDVSVAVQSFRAGTSDGARCLRTSHAVHMITAIVLTQSTAATTRR